MATQLLDETIGLSKNDVIAFYQHIAQQQTEIYSNLINVLLGITVVLIGSTWLWNFIIAKNQIKIEVRQSYDRQVKDVESKIDAITTDKFSTAEARIEQKIYGNEANLARLYALNCHEQQRFTISILWWIIALEQYVEIKESKFIRISVEYILLITQEPNWYDETIEDFDLKKAVVRIEKIVPEILDNEKKEIIQAFKKHLR